MACFHQTSVFMPEPTQPGRARVWAGAFGVNRHAQARQKVRSRRRVGVVIVLVKEMLREFVDGGMACFSPSHGAILAGQGHRHTLNYTFAIANESRWSVL
jgi:hypothetical protein